VTGFDYRLLDTVAVEWNDMMAVVFPDADHTGCRQEMWHNGQYWETYTPARCVGYHCPKCGGPCGSYGHTKCSTTK